MKGLGKPNWKDYIMTTNPRTLHALPVRQLKLNDIYANLPHVPHNKVEYFARFVKGTRIGRVKYYTEKDIKVVEYMYIIDKRMVLKHTTLADIATALAYRGIESNGRLWVNIKGIHIGIPIGDKDNVSTL